MEDEMSGFLRKLKSGGFSKILGNTNLRFFQVNTTSNQFGYRSDLRVKQFKKVVPLNSITEIIDNITQEEKNLCNWKFGFKLRIENRLTTFYAQSESEKLKWVNFFQIFLGINLPKSKLENNKLTSKSVENNKRQVENYSNSNYIKENYNNINNFKRYDKIYNFEHEKENDYNFLDIVKKEINKNNNNFKKSNFKNKSNNCDDDQNSKDKFTFTAEISDFESYKIKKSEYNNEYLKEKNKIDDTEEYFKKLKEIANKLNPQQNIEEEIQKEECINKLGQNIISNINKKDFVNLKDKNLNKKFFFKNEKDKMSNGERIIYEINHFDLSNINLRSKSNEYDSI